MMPDRPLRRYPMVTILLKQLAIEPGERVMPPRNDPRLPIAHPRTVKRAELATILER